MIRKSRQPGIAPRQFRRSDFFPAMWPEPLAPNAVGMPRRVPPETNRATRESPAFSQPLAGPFSFPLHLQPTPGSTRLGVVDMSDDLAQVAHIDQRTARRAIRTRPGFVT